jgi:hypothetical protein
MESNRWIYILRSSRRHRNHLLILGWAVLQWGSRRSGFWREYYFGLFNSVQFSFLIR